MSIDNLIQKLKLCVAINIYISITLTHMQGYYFKTLATWNFFKRAAIRYRLRIFDLGWLWYHIECTVKKSKLLIEEVNINTTQEKDFIFSLDNTLSTIVHIGKDKKLDYKICIFAIY